MASGKQTPRQKMINLMYLVFIAMLALNMSKEVLSAFGSINEKLVSSNKSYEEKNKKKLRELKLASEGENTEFKIAYERAAAVNQLSKTYNDYIAEQKKKLEEQVKDPKDYETMDQPSFLNEEYYKGGKLTEAGQEFLTQMDTYREAMVALIGDTNPTISAQINKDFDTSEIINREGKPNDYIKYNYVGFPLVSSLTKMTQIQNDINKVQNELLSSENEGALTIGSDIEKNYETVMTTSRGAYFTGTTFDGMLSLGRVDASTKPVRVELLLDGKDIKEDQYEFDGGRVVLKVGSGSVGPHSITGKLIYLQNGNEVEVLVDKQFTTINKPKSASIELTKMNVVYRGVSNPMTIKFAGVQDNQVKASAPGLSKQKGSDDINCATSKVTFSHILTPGSGGCVTVNVSGTLPGGEVVKDSKKFRIKDIPRPAGTIAGESALDGIILMGRGQIEKGRVRAKIPDFDFDLDLNVSGFNFIVPGQPVVEVKGKKLNAQGLAALRKAKPGMLITITNIKANIVGKSDYKLKNIPAIQMELLD